MGKLRKIALFIDSQLVVENDIARKFVFLRDQAFLKLQFFAGDRASDLSRCLTQEVRRLQNNTGFLITHTVRKKLVNGKTNEFRILGLEDHSICPVFALEKYVAGAKEMGVDLSVGYLFRILDQKKKQVLESPVNYSVMYGRLKHYLKKLDID